VAHGLRPFPGLAPTRWQVAAFADQVGDQLANVIGQVEVFRETIDDLVNLRQRRAALESQVGRQR
jgi:hypothetical protein